MVTVAEALKPKKAADVARKAAVTLTVSDG